MTALGELPSGNPANGETMMTYTIKKKRGAYHVLLKSNGMIVFLGIKKECEEWLERNGHDEWN